MTVEVKGTWSVALRALESAIDDLRTERVSPYHAVGTGAFWACALDEQLRRGGIDRYDESRDADPNGRVIPGLRLVRNAVTHGAVSIPRSTGLSWPWTWPIDWGPEVYRPLNDILSEFKNRTTKEPERARQDSVYLEMVQGHALADPLDQARRWFTGLESVGWSVPAV